MAVAAIGQVISTAHVPAATPAIAVTQSLRLWTFSTMFLKIPIVTAAASVRRELRVKRYLRRKEILSLPWFKQHRLPLSLCVDLVRWGHRLKRATRRLVATQPGGTDSEMTAVDLVPINIFGRHRSVFFIDEWHLLWGDACGYVWGPLNALKSPSAHPPVARLLRMP
jgi:hypothetical protein